MGNFDVVHSPVRSALNVCVCVPRLDPVVALLCQRCEVQWLFCVTTTYHFRSRVKRNDMGTFFVCEQLLVLVVLHFSSTLCGKSQFRILLL